MAHDPWSLSVLANDPPVHPDLAAADTRLAEVVERRSQGGGASAVMPRELLWHPLWLHPRTASCALEMKRSWWDVVVGSNGTINRWRRNTYVANPRANTTKGASPHGLLRYLDLDVLMALSQAYLRQGIRDLEIAQADLLRWMGYDDLLSAPYNELHSSLDRMVHTRIKLWSGSPDDVPPDNEVIQLITEQVQQDGPRNSVVFNARLGHLWTKMLEEGTWQEIDLDAFAHLARNYRRIGLARVIYAFLTTNRERDGRFCVPKDAIVQRYVPRKPDQVRKRYADDADPRSSLVRALQVLREAGVVAPTSDAPAEFLSGRFITEGVPRLTTQILQRRLITRDFWGQGNTDGQAPRLPGPSAPASPETSATASPPAPKSADPKPVVVPRTQPAVPTAHQPQPRQISLFEDAAPLSPGPVVASATSPPVAPAPTAPTPRQGPQGPDRPERAGVITDPVRASVAILNRDIKVTAHVVREAMARGWTQACVLHLLAELTWRKQTRGGITNPGGLARKMLLDHPPRDYMQPNPEAWAWLATAWPALPVFQPAPIVPAAVANTTT